MPFRVADCPVLVKLTRRSASYEMAARYPPNAVPTAGVPRSHFLDTQRAVIDRLAADRLI